MTIALPDTKRTQIDARSLGARDARSSGYFLTGISDDYVAQQ